MEHRTRRSLSGEIRLLGAILGTTIRRLAGEEAFHLVEEIRAEAKSLRENGSLESAVRLRDRLASCNTATLRMLIRSFTKSM